MTQVYDSSEYQFTISKGEVILSKVSAGWDMFGNRLVFTDLSGINHPKAIYDANKGSISIENDGVTLVLRKTEEVGRFE